MVFFVFIRYSYIRGMLESLFRRFASSALAAAADAACSRSSAARVSLSTSLSSSLIVSVGLRRVSLAVELGADTAPDGDDRALRTPDGDDNVRRILKAEDLIKIDDAQQVKLLAGFAQNVTVNTINSPVGDALHCRLLLRPLLCPPCRSVRKPPWEVPQHSNQHQILFRATAAGMIPTSAAAAKVPVNLATS